MIVILQLCHLICEKLSRASSHWVLFNFYLKHMYHDVLCDCRCCLILAETYVS